MPLANAEPAKFADAAPPSRASLKAAAVTAACYYGAAFLVILWAKGALGDLTVREIFTFALPMALVDGLLAFSLYFVLTGTARMKPILRWSFVVLGVLFVSAVQSVWDTLLHSWSGKLLVYYNSPFEAFVRAHTVNFYQSGLLVALLGFQGAYLQLREQQRHLLASRARERQAQMIALRFQLNPHFLFNSMNAISSLVVLGRNEEAEQMIGRLSDFLRASLAADPAQRITVEEEFEMLEAYLEIEQIRFDERMEAVISLPGELSGCRIPAFLMQPLVENAVKYAVAPNRRTVTVRIEAKAEGEQLLLSIADDGGGDKAAVPSGTGLGLANVRSRLALEYGSAARLTTEPSASGFRAEIRIPMTAAKAGS